MKTLLLLCLLCSACASTRPATEPQWTRLDTGSDASLRGISVAADGSLWVSGSQGTVLRSLDRGASFEAGGPWDAEGDYRDIEAIDQDRAWAMRITEPARVVWTEDGGQSWRVVHESLNSASFFDSIAQLEDGPLLVFGDPQDGVFEILRGQLEAGLRPVPADRLPAAGEGEAAFAASGTCVVTQGSTHAWIGTGGRAARVLRSTDGGESWEAFPTPMPQGEATTGIYSVGFRDLQHGVLVGGDYTQPDVGGNNAAWSADGGRTWALSEPGLSGYRSCVQPVPGQPRTWIAVGRSGWDISRDDGRSWSPFGNGEGYYALAFGADGTGYAVGAEGRAVRLSW